MGKEMDREGMEKAMRLFIDNQEFLEAAMKPLAEMLYAKLTALTDAGFSREEAMDLVKSRGLNA